MEQHGYLVTIKVKDNQLTLIYSPVMASLLACMCAHNVEYEISGLQKLPYEIQLVEEGAIFEEPEFLYKLLGVYE